MRNRDKTSINILIGKNNCYQYYTNKLIVFAVLNPSLIHYDDLEVGNNKKSCFDIALT